MSKSVDTPYSSNNIQSVERNKNSELALLFLLMDICEVVSCAATIGLAMRYIFPAMNQYYSVARFMCRTINLTAQMLIPILIMTNYSLIAPVLSRWVKNIWNKIYNKN